MASSAIKPKVILQRAGKLGRYYLFCVALISFLLPSINIAAAFDIDHPKYRLQKRRNVNGQWDREEGIEPIKIAGEKLSLVSVVFEIPNMNQYIKPRDRYRVGFYLERSEYRVKLVVRDYNLFDEKYHYWVIPLQMRYGSGFCEFSWDASLPKEMNIGIKDLGALTSIGGYGHYVIAPALLYTGYLPSRITVKGLRFIFISNETMTVDYRLYPKRKESRTLLVGKSEDWPKDQKSVIVWNGRDHRNKPARGKRYVLSLTASTTGDSKDRIFYDYEFYYNSVLENTIRLVKPSK